MNTVINILIGGAIGYVFFLSIVAFVSASVYGPIKWNDPDLIEYLLINKSNFTKNPFDNLIISIHKDKRKLDWVHKNNELTFINIFSWNAIGPNNTKGFCVLKFSPLSKVLNEIHREAEIYKFSIDFDKDSADYWKE